MGCAGGVRGHEASICDRSFEQRSILRNLNFGLFIPNSSTGVNGVGTESCLVSPDSETTGDGPPTDAPSPNGT